ncbi:MAG: PilZ domain-containing protein [Thermodesulfobacteriota bacterium]
MLEQRKLKRRQLIYYLKVMNRINGKPLGRLVDITTEGMMLVSSDSIELEVIYKCRLDLPSPLSGRREINFDARALWRNNDVNPDFLDTGFRFEVITPEEARLISDLIDEYELPD